jgi:hypothetical protein
VTEEVQIESPRDFGERRVEYLAREVAQAINAGPTEGREVLRELAVAILRDEVEIVERAEVPAVPAAIGPFNFFGIGIPLFLIGAVLVFLFPPIGLVFFAAGTLTVVFGVGAVLFSRKRKTMRAA